MKHFAARFRAPTTAEILILIHLHLRLVSPEETARCDQLITEQHALKNARVVGQHLRYVVTYQDQWLALATWGAAAGIA